jgi:hypothetical protein
METSTPDHRFDTQLAALDEARDEELIDSPAADEALLGCRTTRTRDASSQTLETI